MDLSRNVANRREFTTFSRNSMASRILVAFSQPINENSPNWNMYRLSLGRMSRIRDVVPFTYWRATCEFPIAGIDYRDYVRAKLADVDPMTCNGAKDCKTVEYRDINIRGHVGVRTTVGTIISTTCIRIPVLPLVLPSLPRQGQLLKTTTEAFTVLLIPNFDARLMPNQPLNSE